MRSMVLLSLLALAAGCDPIVGARCADGLVLCEGRCVATCTGMDGGADGGEPSVDGSIDDGAVDGAVDASIDDASVIDGSVGDASVLDGSIDDASVLDGSIDDASVIDGSIDDASVLDASVLDGSLLDGSVPDGSSGDGGSPMCGLGELECSGICVDGLTDPSHCGACDRACGPAEVCASGVCRLTCDPPLVLCAGRCIDVSSDPENCGGCGVVCGLSGLCIDGECSSALAGHVVVIGHDYVSSRTAQDRLAGNALFLARGNPVRALVWTGSAPAASRAGVIAAIDRTATASGRSWMRTEVTAPEDVPLRLADSDALIVLAQAAGTDDAALRGLGAAWSAALGEFLDRGGVVVLFDTMTAAHAGTWQILDAAGLFSATGRSVATGAVITIAAPADAVAARVPLSYLAQPTTVRFATTDTTVVARDGTGPVVVHRTVIP